MKRIPLIIVAALSLFVVTAGITGPIYWPVGPTGTQDTTRTLFHSFGNFHVGWDSVGQGGWDCNFHMGIDILPYNGNRDVRACKDGYISNIIGIPCETDSQYVAVIVDTLLNQPPGWSYQHIHNPRVEPYCWTINSHISMNDLLSEMDTLPTTNHMHLSWSPYEYDSSVGSEINPLDSLINASTGLDWVWNRVFGSYPVGYDTLMCIPDVSHLSWPSNSRAFNNLLIPLNSVYGDVDLLYGYCLEAIGSVGFDAAVQPLNPERMKWTLYELGNLTKEERFTRYVVDFSGILGRTPEDSVEYRQHYFRLNPFSSAGLSGSGWISCITNCSDTTSIWMQPGIENIQENFWKTNLHQCGSGSATIPESAMYPDGCYEVKVTSFARGGTMHEFPKQIVLDNFAPSVNSVKVYQKTPYKLLYEAYWETLPNSIDRMLTSSTMGYLSDSLSSNIGVAVGFTEPMNPDALPELWFTGEWAEWAGGSSTWSSATMGQQYQLTPCEWDTENLESMPANSWHYYCYETDSGITDYHGQLSLIISGGKDLSGNPIDGDPSTVSQLRTSSGGHTAGYESGADDSYMWAEACPVYSTYGAPSNTVNGQYSLGSSGGSFQVPLFNSVQDFAFVRSTPDMSQSGCCPWAHGFWLSGTNKFISGTGFYVVIVDFLGDVVRQFWQKTLFIFEAPPDPPCTFSFVSTNNKILSGENFGNYCWIGVTSMSVRPYSSDRIRTEPTTQLDSCDYIVDSYTWLHVYCFSATGEAQGYFLGEGPWHRFCSFEHDTSNPDNIDVVIEVDSLVYDTINLSPPTAHEISLLSESPSAKSISRIAINTMEFNLILGQNPVSSSAVFQVMLEDAGYTELNVYDMSGRIVQPILSSVMQAGSHSVSLPLRLPSGVYFCKLTSGSQSTCEKLMVIR